MDDCVIDCPYCQAELVTSETCERYICDHCRRDLNVPAQLLFARGRDLLVQAQELSGAMPPRRQKAAKAAQEQQMLPYLQRAYSALQEAFVRDLSHDQCEEGIQMMADLGRTLNSLGKIPTLEARYWATLMVELSARRELQQVQNKITSPTHRGVLGWPWRWRWRSRRGQLHQAMARLDQEIRRIETEGRFVDPPRARYWANETADHSV